MNNMGRTINRADWTLNTDWDISYWNVEKKKKIDSGKNLYLMSKNK